jgi:glycosyltransferase involved in cell wall biosynthesis
MQPPTSQTDSPLRVLMVSPEFPPYLTEGGLGTHVSELANGLSRHGCEVTVLAPTIGPSASHRQANAGTVHLVSLAGLAGVSSVNELVKGLANYAADFGRRLIAEQGERPDLIHCHDWTSISAAQELGKTFETPVVGTVHLLQEPLYRWWALTPSPEVVEQERALCCAADALISVSQSMRQVIQETYQIPDDRIHVVYNGLDARQFLGPRLDLEQVSELKEAIASPGEKIVLFAGRLVRQKGISALLESAVQVVRAIPNVRYLIVGGDGYFDASRREQQQAQILQRLQAEYPMYSNLWSRIKILGMVTRAQLSLLYQVADMALVPSLYEPFGYAAIEPMAAGLPVVATDVGGLSEIIQQGETGWLVPVHANEQGLRFVDVTRLAEAQIMLLSNESLARQIGDAGQRHVLETFNLERMIQATLRVYKQTISRFNSNLDPFSGLSFSSLLSACEGQR